MRFSSCVGIEWNILISNCRQLLQRRSQFDPYGYIHEKNKIPRDRISLGSRISVASNGKEILITDNSNHRVLVYTEDGQKVSSFGCHGNQLGQFNSPKAICASREEIFIVDTWNSRIQIFDRHYSPISSISLDNYNPLSICCSNSGDIYLASGAIFKVHRGKVSPVGNYTTRCSMGTCVNSKGQIIMSDATEHRIAIFDPSGDLVKIFGSCGSGDYQFIDPYGVHVDQEDNLLVCDSLNSRISVYNSEYVLVRHISVHAQPCDVCILGRKMFVKFCEGFVKIYS